MYPVLRRLEAEGLISGEPAGKGERPRTIYHITTAGETELNQWLKMSPAPPVLREELPLKVFFGRGARPALARHVRRCRDDCKRRLDELIGIAPCLESSQAAERPYWLISLSMGFHRARAYLAWCEETLAAVGCLGEDSAVETASAVCSDGEEEF